MADIPYSRLTDIIALIVEMQGKYEGVCIQDVERICSVSRRTAERILEAIKNAIPQVSEIESLGKKKYWGFSNYSLSALVSFSPEEVALMENAKKTANSTIQQQLDDIITKIKALNSKKKYTLAREVEFLLKSEGIAMSQQPYFDIDIRLLSTIRKAIKEQRKLRGEYNGKQKILSPLGIMYGEKVYLIAREEDKGKGEYYYKLNNLKNLEVTVQKFDPDGFDINEFSKKSFGIYQGEIYKVKLLFSPNVREDVLHYKFHPTQKIKEQEDGSIIVTFKASGALHIFWHLVKWGSDVKILSPLKLRKDYIEYLNNCAKAQG